MTFLPLAAVSNRDSGRTDDAAGFSCGL